MRKKHPTQSETASMVIDAISRLKGRHPPGDLEATADWATVETYLSVSLEVLSKTNPSKLRAAAMNAELRSLIAPSTQK